MNTYCMFETGSSGYMGQGHPHVGWDKSYTYYNNNKTRQNRYVQGVWPGLGFHLAAAWSPDRLPCPPHHAPFLPS